jgi:hypothetical protein
MIYISLTTVPKRINHWESFVENLTSLLNQKTDKDYKILLNLPHTYKNNNNEEYNTPTEFSEFVTQNSKIIVNRVEKDYGPIVKITGALSFTTNPEDVLIVCDDDHVYHEDMLEYHLKKMLEYPESIICFRGDNPIEKREWIEDGVTKYTLKPTHFYFPIKYDGRLIQPGHWHSVSYKINYFGDDFLDESFLSMSTNDDVLCGYYFRLKEKPIICATWENETDWRPVNEDGRGSNSFPIVKQLGYPNSGFSEFRKQSGDHMGVTDAKIFKEFTENNHKIYIENKKIMSINPKRRVVVTLTTIPTRLSAEHEQGIKSNIRSLIEQDYNGEYEIHLNVPSVNNKTGEQYIVPSWMRELSLKEPKFKIFENLEDYGPITKLIPTLKRVTEPDAIIIVCDDDLIYQPKMVEEQVKNQETYENTACGYDGSRCVNTDDFDDVRNAFVVSVCKDVYVKVLQHYKTISYRRHFFKDDLYNEFIGQSWNDDILVSAYMGKHGIKKLVRFYEHEEQLITIEQWREKGGVTTFPVINHTHHEGQEGCNLMRTENVDDNHMKFINLGWI